MSHYKHELTDFRPGQRVELHPACDLWMRGVRYGEVLKVTRTYVHVQPDHTSKPVMLRPYNVAIIDD